MKKYEKVPLRFAEQIRLLESRGLIIENKAAAAGFLEAVNYYRFSAYCPPFETERHSFAAGARFEQIEELYEFDRRLRMLIVEIVEPIKVSVRTGISYRLAHQYGAFAHTKADNFRAQFEHAEWTAELLEETGRSQEVFVRHFKEHYEEFPSLPIWAAVEIMSFGRLSKLFSGLPTADKQAVSVLYQVRAPVLRSWLHTLVYIRNLCAHHARLWNREMMIAPMLPDKNPLWELRHPKRLVSTLFLLNWLISRIPRRETIAADWRARVEGLLINDMGAPNFYAAMGLPADWKSHPLWKITP
jgi:abortive infection bacteriophage resistance protein